MTRTSPLAAVTGLRRWGLEHRLGIEGRTVAPKNRDTAIGGDSLHCKATGAKVRFQYREGDRLHVRFADGYEGWIVMGWPKAVGPS